MAVAPNQKMASILGRVERERTRSTKESMARNKNMGWWRLCSVWMRKSRTPFPVTARKNMKQKGSEIQMWTQSVLGCQPRRKCVGRDENYWKKSWWSSHLEVWSAPAKKSKQVKFNEEIRSSGYVVSLTPPSPSVFPHYSKKVVKSNFQFSQYFCKIFKHKRGKSAWSSGKCIVQKKAETSFQNYTSYCICDLQQFT